MRRRADPEGRNFTGGQPTVPHQGHGAGGMLALPPMQNSYLSQQCGGQYFNYCHCHTNLSFVKSSRIINFKLKLNPLLL